MLPKSSDGTKDFQRFKFACNLYYLHTVLKKVDSMFHHLCTVYAPRTS